MTDGRQIPSPAPAAFSSRRAPKPFYVLRELPCPYLSGQQERKIITDLSGANAQALHGDLSRGGFRRSHMFAYRPACPACSACVPVRVPAAEHRPSKSQRRILRRNQDLAVSVTTARVTDEQYDLFARYLHSRHADGEMADMTFSDYRQMVEETAVASRLAEFRDGDDQLLAVCLFDLMDDGTSAVYTFFDPRAPARSLGTFTVLWLIDATWRWAGTYVYLGYWIPGSRKMEYKSRFKPLEKLTGEGWQRADPGAARGSGRTCVA